MSIAWPAPLQQLLLEANFGFEMGDTTIRSDMDTGPQKVRRRTTRPINKLSGAIQMTTDEFNIFYTFFNTTLNGGVLAFDFDHPITRVKRQFRFIGAPKINSIGGGYFQAQFQWEELP